LRWEYRLGSTLYLVYTHSQDDIVTTDLVSAPAALDFKIAAPRAASDAFLVKATYWFAP
jgi:hypothetical protein